MPEKDRRPRPPLRPLESDKDLYILENLRRDTKEEQRFREAVIQEVEKLGSKDKPA